MVAQSSAYKAWAKEKTVVLSMRLQRSTDADILEFLEGKQKQTEIKKALRYYISAQAENNEKEN